jgi:hypothetical protein
MRTGPGSARPTAKQLKAALAASNSDRRKDIFYAYSCSKPDIKDLPILRKALKDSEFPVVQSAAISIGKLGPAAIGAADDLYDAAHKQHPDFLLPQAYSECLEALVSLGAEEDMLLDLIQSHFAMTNWSFLKDSLHGLKKLGTPKASNLLSRIITFARPDLNKQQLRYVQTHFRDRFPRSA